MKKLFVLLYMGLVFTLPGCETILPVDIPEGEEWGITLNALASPDTTFQAYVTHCYPNSDAPDYNYKNQSIDNYWEPDPYSDYIRSMLYKISERDGAPPFNYKKGYDLIKKSVLANAKVELTVNGNTDYPMVFDTLMLCFQSNYTPAIGDRLEVRIDNGNGEQTVARTEVPRPQKLEILELNTEILEKEEIIGAQAELGLTSSNRGYVRMKLRLHDPAEEKNYYRLAIRGIIYNKNKTYPIVWDMFQSSDPIFRDDRLTSSWSIWESFFSNVFDDTLINGNSYEFEVKTYVLGYLWDGKWPIYEVSLQSITEDYYRYLKSLELYRISRTDTYSEGLYIHSNNEGGWGVLGGISGEVHRVEPFREKYE